MATTKVRAMRDADVPQVAAIEAGAFSDPWPASAFEDLLDRSYARLRVAVDDGGTVLGYCVLLRAADEGEIANIATASTARGQGIGGRLLDDALTSADGSGTRAVFLEVRVSNAAARGLYGSRGFQEVGSRRGYYQNPDEDALVLRRLHPDSRVQGP
jgi:ribosomal-protein-alanine N-acetyltransferase